MQGVAVQVKATHYTIVRFICNEGLTYNTPRPHSALYNIGLSEVAILVIIL